MSQIEHFDRLAERYDTLRVPPGLTVLHDTLVTEGDLAGTRVLDIGCGTGAALAVLADHFGCKVAGVDPSAGMLAQARARLPAADVREGTAERLPFGDGAFDAALMMTVVHLVDRPRAFPEARRVLAPAGRFLVVTPDPAAFARAWMAQLFPSYVAVEQARFPAPDVLERELLEAGFDSIRLVRRTVPRRFSREQALERLRGRAYSTLDHLPPGELADGIARGERELPEVVEYLLEWTIVVAARE